MTTNNIIINKFCSRCSTVRTVATEWPCKTPYCKTCWKLYTKERRTETKTKQTIKKTEPLDKKCELSAKDTLRKMISDSIDKCDNNLSVFNMAILFTSIFMAKVVQYTPPIVNIVVQPICIGDGINLFIHDSTSNRISKILPICTDNILLVRHIGKSGVRITKYNLEYDIDDLYNYEVRWYKLNDDLILDAAVLEKNDYIISGLDYTPYNSSDTSPTNETCAETLIDKFNDYDNIFDGYDIDDIDNLLEQFDIN